MRLIHILLFFAAIIVMNGCTSNAIPRGWKKKEVTYVCTTQPIAKPSKLFKKIQKTLVCKKVSKPKKPKRLNQCITNSASYKNFRASTNLRKSFKVYKDKKLLHQATSTNTKLTIDISEQRVRLYVNNAVALDAPCTTGAKHKFEPNTKIYRDKRTPKGTFRIREKIRNKRSSIFGDYYRGKKRVYHGDRRKYKGSKKGLRYEGALLKNWMRLTGSGIGLHASKYVKRNPGTNGCIRLQGHVAKTIFAKVKTGTKVTVQN